MANEKKLEKELTNGLAELQRKLNRVARKKRLVNVDQEIILDAQYRIVPKVVLTRVKANSPRQKGNEPTTAGLSKRARKFACRALHKDHSYGNYPPVSLNEVAGINLFTLNSNQRDWIGKKTLAELNAAMHEHGIKPEHPGWPPPQKPDPAKPVFRAKTNVLTTEDWDAILNGEWRRKPHRTILLYLKEKNNAAHDYDDLNAIGKNEDPSFWLGGTLNNEFRKLNLNYRLTCFPRGTNKLCIAKGS